MIQIFWTLIDGYGIGRDTVAINHRKSRRFELFLVFGICDSWMIHNIHNYFGQHSGSFHGSYGWYPKEGISSLNITGDEQICPRLVLLHHPFDWLMLHYPNMSFR